MALTLFTKIDDKFSAFRKQRVSFWCQQGIYCNRSFTNCKSISASLHDHHVPTVYLPLQWPWWMPLKLIRVLSLALICLPNPDPVLDRHSDSDPVPDSSTDRASDPNSQPDLDPDRTCDPKQKPWLCPRYWPKPGPAPSLKPGLILDYKTTVSPYFRPDSDISWPWLCTFPTYLLWPCPFACPRTWTWA
jgi:hypothetical protein